jgi:hypothetical protein
MKFYQLCYTRIGGQGINDGWQLVNASPDAPASVKKSFSELQSANIVAQSALTSLGENQRVIEVQSDGDAIYVSRIQYGLTDQLGRPNVFIHGFALPAGEAVTAPSEIVGISGGNFHFDEESTSAIPDTLAVTARTSLSDVVSRAGLTGETYETLMLGVYAILDNKAKSTLYVQYDGTQENLFDLAFCVYSGLPFFLRRKISFADYDNGCPNIKTVIFGTDVRSAQKFLIPKTGENNVLTDSLITKLKKLDFTTLVPRHIAKPDMNDYFTELERTLAQLGGTKNVQLATVKIAHDIILGETSGSDFNGYTDEDLTRQLNEFISAGIRGNEYFDGKVSDVLSEILGRRAAINNTISEKLSDFLKDTRSERLIETGYFYQMRKVTALDASDGAQYIAKNLKPGTKLFGKVLELLRTDSDGVKILDLYYAGYFLPEDGVTREDLTELYAKTRNLHVTDAIKNRLGAEAAKLYFDRLKAPCDEPALTQELHELLSELLPGQSALIEKYTDVAYNHYWDSFDIGTIDFDNKVGLNSVVMKGNRNCDLARRVFKIGKLLEKDELTQFANELRDFQMQDEYTQRERDLSTAALISRAVEFVPQYGERDLLSWVKIAVLGGEGKNPVPFLIRNRVQAFTVSFVKEAWGEDFPQSIRENLLACMNDVATDKSAPGYDVVSRLLAECRERDKRSLAEEKQRAKEERRARRDEIEREPDNASAEDKPADKTIGGVVGDSLSKIKGIFGKPKK